MNSPPTLVPSATSLPAALTIFTLELYISPVMWTLPRYSGRTGLGYTYPEDFFTHIITQNDKLMDCVGHFHTILDTIPQSETSFQIAKEGLTKQLASRRVTKFALINAWIAARDMGLDYDINKPIYEALPQLTMNDVVDFEQQQIARKPYRYIILGDERDLDMKSLQQYGPVRRVSLAEIFGY